ncbi:MAG: hypothetical protein L3J71_04145 [Victivallaceae bacterium]|nr:hypothetical protein [Victivallaceae bacterium]
MSICRSRSIRSSVIRNLKPVAVIAIALFIGITASAAKKLNWQHNWKYRALSAGKADLVTESFTVSRTLGAPNFSPEFKFPVQMIYNSGAERFGMLGYRWRMPQLESRLFPQSKKLEWITPWSEKVYFFPKTKPDKNTLELYKAQMRGKGYFSPYADWEAFPNKKDKGNCTVVGKKSYKGWKFVYRKSRLDKVFAPSGRMLNFSYRNNKLTAVTEQQRTLLTVTYNKNRCAEKMVINGIEYSFNYSKIKPIYLPTKLPADGSQPKNRTSVELSTLAAFARGSLTPTTFKYDDLGFLNQIATGDNIENIIVQHETLTERLEWLQKYADAKKDKKHRNLKRSKFNGRILADNFFTYSYSPKTVNMSNLVKLRNRAGQHAKYDYNQKTGILKVTDFAGRSSEIFYFRRYDVAYNGKLRQVVDARNRTTATYRYDKKSGKITRFRDMADNITFFDYDRNEQLIKVSRSQNSMIQPRLPLVKLRYDAKGNPIEISRVNPKGKAVTTTTLYYDRYRQVTGVKAPESTVSFKYNKFGRPTQVSDTFGRSTYYRYDKFNRVIELIAPNHIRTSYKYDLNGMISSITRTDASRTRVLPRQSPSATNCLSSVTFKYSPTGTLFSYTDNQNRTRRFDRDAEGRITAEFFPDNSSVKYFYDKLGRLAKVLDQNRNPIKFKHSKFGSIARKTTAAGQITDYRYDQYGLLKSTSNKYDARSTASTGAAGTKPAGATRRTDYDKFDRITKIDYGNGQTKSFTYNQRGKLLSVTQSSLGILPENSTGNAGNVGADLPVAKKSTKTVVFTYDIFDRLIKKIETTVTNNKKSQKITAYSYTKNGKRRAMKITFQDGSTKLTKWKYDPFGRLIEINDDGKIVTYEYDLKTALLSKQLINGIPVYYSYTKYNQLESKSLGAPLPGTTRVPPRQKDSLKGLSYSTSRPISYVKYFYAPDGSITAREVNGSKQLYEYDLKNQLTAVKDTQGNIVEQYTYDPAGNILKKTINSIKTSFEYDAANQLVSSNVGATSQSRTTTAYTYDAAGRMIKEGNKTYTYGWLDKVMSITQNGKVTANYDYHVNGQIATASIYSSKGERPFAPTVTSYEWDGLALIKRGSTSYTNEPAVTGGNPILATNNTNGTNLLFNDMLGTTIGTLQTDKFNRNNMTSFGVPISKNDQRETNNDFFFTGKPQVEGLGYAFLFRNYRADLGKWQTADPLGYPDGWNNLAYVNNGVTSAIDWLGGALTTISTIKPVVNKTLHFDLKALGVFNDDYDSATISNVSATFGGGYTSCTTGVQVTIGAYTFKVGATIAVQNISGSMIGSPTSTVDYFIEFFDGDGNITHTTYYKTVSVSIAVTYEITATGDYFVGSGTKTEGFQTIMTLSGSTSKTVYAE